MKTVKMILAVVGCLVANISFAQNYLPYYPADWDFKNEVDLVDFSQVKSVATKLLTIDENEEYPVLETYHAWNSTHQLTDFQFVNYNNSYADFDVRIQYANPNGNQPKSVTIINPNTLKPLEEWQYSNGSFDVEKIVVKRYLLNVPQPDVFEVKYEGIDEDFSMETVYTPAKSIHRQTKRWYRQSKAGNYTLVKKVYLGKELKHDQTDSLLLNQHQKTLALYQINLGIASETRYLYKTRKVEISGDEYDYEDLVRLQKDGKDSERYEYEYDAKGNWTVCKIYKMKNGKWEYTDVKRREIEYRN